MGREEEGEGHDRAAHENNKYIKYSVEDMGSSKL